MQMHRMWIFAWDHNARQPKRVNGRSMSTRAEAAGVSPGRIAEANRLFFTRRVSMRYLPVPRSMAMVWQAEIHSPPVRWKNPQKCSGPRIPDYARLDLSFARIHGQ